MLDNNEIAKDARNAIVIEKAKNVGDRKDIRNAEKAVNIRDIKNARDTRDKKVGKSNHRAADKGD